MRWWYFHREDDALVLAVDKDFPNRPLDANPNLGNSHTPWYKNTNHFDEYHVHIYAPNYWSAYAKAISLINS